GISGAPVMANFARYLLLSPIILFAVSAAENDGVYVRFKLIQPAGAKVHFTLGGYIHNEPWYLPTAHIPAGADKKDSPRIASGQFTDWFDLKAFAGKRLHGKMNRAGGVAEWPNVTVKCLVEPPATHLELETELATAPDAAKVAKHWREEFDGD